jgi:HAD superfamily hydrolase (TIGR01509 family)
MALPTMGGNQRMTGADAVLFDMDGLLIDSEPLWLEAETAVMARLGAAWTTADQAQLLGGSLKRTVRYLMGKATRPASPELVAEWLMSGVCDLVRERGVPLQPGAPELLAEVAAAGLPRALVTSSERRFMDAVLDRTGLRFDVLVCANDVTMTKPDPEPYLLAAKLLGADPARCVALEDSPNGVTSAEAAGCQVIAVPSLIPIEPGPGRAVVRSLAELRAHTGGVSLRGPALPRIRGIASGPARCRRLRLKRKPRGGAHVHLRQDRLAATVRGTDRAPPGRCCR